MKLEKIRNLDCFCDFSHGATIRTNSGRFLGATCDLGEVENIIRTYFQTEIFPEAVHVFFGGKIGENEIWGDIYIQAHRLTKIQNKKGD